MRIVSLRNDNRVGDCEPDILHMGRNYYVFLLTDEVYHCKISH